MEYKNIIYGLRDPRSDVYQYIGKSRVGNKRALSHLTNSHSPSVNKWVKDLSEQWLYPHVDIIEEVDDIDNLPKRESYWISYYYNINEDILNIQIPSINNRNVEDEENFNFLKHTVFFVGDILKKERICRNITQSELSKEMGVSRSTLSLMERGENVNINVIKKCILALVGKDILSRSNNERASKKSSF